MSDDIVSESPLQGDDTAEVLSRHTDEHDIRGVTAKRVEGRDQWQWQVRGGVAEFLREDPLEAEMRQGMDTALRAVPGVTGVAAEDREVWVVTGTPSGEALVRAAERVVDALADRAREPQRDLGPLPGADHVSIVVDWVDDENADDANAVPDFRLWRLDVSPQSMAYDERLPDLLRFLGDRFEQVQSRDRRRDP